MGPNCGIMTLRPVPTETRGIVELVVAGDRAEVGEDDLVERVAGVPGELVLDRADRHHHAAGRHVEYVRADRAVLEPAQAAEVTREIRS